MKKAICIILTLLLVIASLAACGNTAGNDQTSDPTENSKTESAAETNAEEIIGESTADSEAVENPASGSETSGLDSTQPGDNPSNEGTGDPGGTPPDGGAGGPGGTPPDGGAGGPGGTPPDGGAGGPGDTPPDGGAGGPGGTPPDGGAGGPGGSSADISYTGAEEVTASDAQDGMTYSSSTSDESALLISTSEDVVIDNGVVEKTGDSDGGDNCNFYGLNAAVLVKGGTNTTIEGATVTSDASGANGVFCYGGNGGHNGADGDGTTLTIRNSQITTTGDGSGGIMTTGGGVTYAYDLEVETSGRSSAAIRTDRGGGTVFADGGTYTSNGLGSPAIYSTADITVENATLVSNLSEGVCIEGKNSITLNNCDLTANNTQCNGHATFYDTIMIYQSMSGDADSGTSSFTMNGGRLERKNGHMFHVTNTNAVINLTEVTLVNDDVDNVLLSVCSDGWSGAGNIAALNAELQTLEGTILVGSDSELTLKLTDSSSFEGCFSGEITNAKGNTVSGEIGTVAVILDDTSTWTLTADCYISSFEGNPENVITGGYTLYVNGTPLA